MVTVLHCFCWLFSHLGVSDSATPWTAALQDSLSFTIFWNLPKPMSIESVVPSNYLVLCHPLLLPPSIFSTIRVFSNESVLHIRWPKYWGFSFSINSSNIQGWFPLGWTGWLSLQSKGLSRVFSNTIVQKHQFTQSQCSGTAQRDEMGRDMGGGVQDAGTHVHPLLIHVDVCQKNTMIL